ncbi:MAG: family 5 extracellular solute-binding protein, peptide/nickel transport system substrate-binding [Parcubacteria group bacterium]|nr:family 5 extracellular solute-binding protein, peptide/nickel transport system substrate-binding [Parcubacteria group bacterium]
MKEGEDKILNKKKGWNIPKSSAILKTIASFSITEKIIFYFFLLAFIISSALLLWKVNQSYLVEFPAHGGQLKEGIIGSPRFINPILAISDADRDMTSLIYSGLMKSNSAGDIVPDLAESYSISKDGLIYKFKLKDNAYFHNGEKVTADDVEFTVNKTQDSALKSPKRANWDGVAVRKLNDREIEFVLKQPYSPFLENTTLGILPKKIWTNFDSDQFSFSLFNIEPIGSGPYKVKGLEKDSYGIPTYYTLVSFNKYISGAPYIKKLLITFYQNEKSLIDSFKRRDIESISAISSENAEMLKTENGLRVIRAPLPRIFGVFFNQSQAPIFANKEIREALNATIDRDRIVKEVLHGYGIEIDSPIPPDLMEIKNIAKNETNGKKEDGASRIEEALAKLQDNGWKMNNEEKVLEKKMKNETEQLRFSISTSNTPELKKVAEIAKEDWEKLGAKVEVKIFESGDLNQNVIRPRKYDALLFGEIIGRDLDLFAFWHSSQRKDPGLNIALYANSKVDKLLEDARKIEDKSERIQKYKQFENEVRATQ